MAAVVTNDEAPGAGKGVGANEHAKKQDESQLRATLNGMGWSMGELSPVFNAWAASAKDCDAPLLDVGCAFGLNTLAAAASGRDVVALDMDAGHLEHVEAEAKRRGLAERVSTKMGKLPDELHLEPESISGALVAEVLHFVRGPDIDIALAALYEALVPGGIVAITAVGDYAQAEDRPAPLREGVTDAIARSRASGKFDETWPGQVMDFDNEKAGRGLAALGLPHAFLGDFFHMLEPEVLSAALERAGFHVMCAVRGTHAGHPPGFALEGMSTQVVGIKPIAQPKADDLGLLTTSDGAKLTKNGKGFQMSCPSPLFDVWTGGADGTHPILDLGCAYGKNALAAASLGHQVIALDMAPEHLDVVSELAERQGVRERVTIRQGQLPSDLNLPDESVSSVLVAEVFHFLEGRDIDASLAQIHRILVPGGSVAITAVSDYVFRIGDLPDGSQHPIRAATELAQRKAQEAGLADPNWPGEIRIAQHVDVDKLEGDMAKLGQSMARGSPFFHMIRPDTLAAALQRAGFRLVRAELGNHPGHPMGHHLGNNSTQVVATKAEMEEKKEEAETETTNKPESTEDEFGVTTMPDGCKPTRNGTGFMMSQRSPVFEQWTNGYDGEHPVVDIGCAYGRNTLDAARLGHRVIGIDLEPEHLRVVQAAAERFSLQDLVSTKLGRLPDGLQLEPESVSSVLIAEVLHFLTGDQIDTAVQNIHKALVPGGILAITTTSHAMVTRPDIRDGKLHPLKRHCLESLDMERAAGTVDDRWPYMMHIEKHGLLPKLQAMCLAEGVPKEAAVGFFHCISPESMTATLERAGFRVISAQAGTHPGHPDAFRREGDNTQVVAVK